MSMRFLTIYAGLFLVFLYLPVLLLPLFSFNDSAVVSFPLRGFTTQWYENLMSETGMQRALVNSLKVAVSVSVIATLLGLGAARAVTRYGFFGKKAITGFIMLPLVMPEFFAAISLLILLIEMGLGLSLLSVALGHILLCVPFSMVVLISSLEGFDRSLEEASLDLGEGPFMTFVRVTLPIAAPGVVASLLLTFAISLDEFILAFFLSGTEPTLPVYIWGQLRFIAKLPNTVALGSLLLLASFLMLGAGELLRRRARRRTRGKGAVH